MGDKTAPDSQLRLDWVYGYRGHQCRNNLYYTSTGEVVYFVAGVGVVYNATEGKQRFFLEHTDDIISLALHPDRHVVATAQTGKAPFICVWDCVTMETVSILQGGHERGIAALNFSGNGNLLASVGMDDYHSLNVWDWRKGKVVASTRGHSDRIFDVQFNPHATGSLVTCGVKHIKFWTLSGNTLTGKKGIFGKKGELQSILCAAFCSAEVVITGTLSGDLYKWTGHTLSSVIKGAHAGAIYSLHGSDGGFASGSRDGTVRLWDSDTHPITTLNIAAMTIGYKGLCVRSVCWDGERVLVGTKDSEVVEVTVADKDNPTVITQGHTEGELWALAVHYSQPVFATGSDDKSVRVWSLEDHSMLACCYLPHPVRSLAFSPDGTHLTAGMQDGSFSVLDAGSLSEVVHIKKRKEVLHEMKYSPSGHFLAVGSNDNFVDVYSVSEGYKHVGTCSGSSSFITHLDWSVDSKYIQTNSGASERLHYQMPSGKRVTATEEIQAIQWSTWTSVLGSEVNGIWPKYSQVNDVNATDAVFAKQVIATGDDFGLVKLFRFPSVKKGAKFKKYVGHSAHVTNVRFSHDQRHLISVGGADHAVFQWNFLSGEGDEEQSGGVAPGSDSEESDSDMSDAAAVDSEVEREQEKTYDRTVYREDLQKLKHKLLEREKEAEKATSAVASPGVKGHGRASSSSAAAARRGRKTGPPEDSLRLEFVHGYRGYDCRSNLYYTQDGHIVYHIAALGIIYDSHTHSQQFYSAHTDDILCLTLHPGRDYVATGQIGRDPAIHVWDAASLSTLSILQGEHQRGVCSVGFSADGKKLASVGLDNDHSIVVWDWRKGEKLATTRGHKDKIFLLSWNPCSGDQLVTVGIKHIKFWKQAGGGFTSKRGVFGRVGKSGTMLSVTFSADGERCFSGGSDGKIYHWAGSSLAEVVEGHKGPVFALQRVEKGYVSGGKDGAVCLWNDSFQNRLKTYHLQSDALEGGARLTFDLPAVRALCLGEGKILVGTKNSEILEIEKSGPISLLIQGHMEREAWGLSTHPSQSQCVSASDDGSVRFWDLKEHKQAAIVSLPGRKARAVGYSHDGAAVAVGFMDGGFIVLKSDTLEQLASFQHRTQEISDVKFSPNGKYLAIGSHDNFVDIYHLVTKKRVGICKGASSYITHIDWDKHGKLLQVNTGDREVLYYEAPRGKQHMIGLNDAEELEWSTWTCVLGDSCTGIWPAYTDVTDVNAACKSRDNHVIATGDDFGLVKLFSYPSYEKHAKCKQYVGHSAHVTSVRWSHDDRQLVSLGGADMSLMVWSHSAGSRDPVSTDADQSNPSLITSSLGYLSEESDTDSEEEGGYDSDVEREKKMDYQSKIYSAPIRDVGAGIKPHLQEDKAAAEPSSRRQAVSRSVTAASRVVTREEGRVDVKDLSLEYIFGYRGFDTRHNLLYSSDGLIVYPAAGAGVVYNPLTQQQSFYLEHNDDIICVGINRNPKLSQVVATGQLGKTGAIHVWDLHTKQTLSVLQGAHSVGVSSVDFSCNGKLLLSVGLDTKYSVTVWRWTDGTKVAQTSADKRRVFLAQFRPDSNTQFVSCGVKHVRFWNLAGTQLLSQRGSLPKTIGAAMQTMLSLAFAQDNVTYTGSINGDVYVWKGSILSHLVSRAHSGPVFAMFTCLDDGLIVSAGKDTGDGSEGGRGGGGGVGEVKLWTADMSQSRSVSLGRSGGTVIRSVCRSKGKILVGTQSNEIVEVDEKTGQVQTPVRGHGEGELWGLAVHPTALTFITASDDKTVRLWDLNTKAMVCQKQLDHSARSADFSPEGAHVAVGMKNGEFLMLSATDLSVMGRRRDRSKTIEAVRFSPDSGRLAVGSDDACVDIYSLSPSVSRVAYCRGIPSFVTQLDWSQNGRHLQVSTGVYERLVFEVASGKQITSSDVINKITWASWTSVLGEEVVGVWPRNADKADVNTAHLNHSGTAVATGDDFGCLKLFTQFPLTEKFAPHKKFFGHSAHVTNVKFTHDDRYLLSAGGDDSCVFVWKCITADV